MAGVISHRPGFPASTAYVVIVVVASLGYFACGAYKKYCKYFFAILLYPQLLRNNHALGIMAQQLQNSWAKRMMMNKILVLVAMIIAGRVCASEVPSETAKAAEARRLLAARRT